MSDSSLQNPDLSALDGNNFPLRWQAIDLILGKKAVGNDIRSLCTSYPRLCLLGHLSTLFLRGTCVTVNHDRMSR